jgi:hypothetical protein
VDKDNNNMVLKSTTGAANSNPNGPHQDTYEVVVSLVSEIMVQTG